MKVYKIYANSDQKFCVHNSIYRVPSVSHGAQGNLKRAAFEVGFLHQPVINMIIFFLVVQDIPAEDLFRVKSR